MGVISGIIGEPVNASVDVTVDVTDARQIVRRHSEKSVAFRQVQEDRRPDDTP